MLQKQCSPATTGRRFRRSSAWLRPQVCRRVPRRPLRRSVSVHSARAVAASLARSARTGPSPVTVTTNHPPSSTSNWHYLNINFLTTVHLSSEQSILCLSVFLLHYRLTRTDEVVHRLNLFLYFWNRFIFIFKWNLASPF